jgi:predicted aspartyl protease
MCACALSVLSAPPLADETTRTADEAHGASPVPLPEQVPEIIVQAPEPRFVAPTRRDRIGRIWAPVLIDGKGPYRLVLDTGANRSAITAHVAETLGLPPAEGGSRVVNGFTGSTIVPLIHVSRVEVGDVLIGPADMPVLADVFGDAEGVLGNEGLMDKRIYADFTSDQLVISRSHGERAEPGLTVVPLRIIEGGLLVADVRVGSVRAKAIIDTGAQGSVGNLVLRSALTRRRPHDTVREEIVGVSLDVQSGDRFPAPDIDFGHLTVHGMAITFGDMYLFHHWKMTDEPTLTLGMDLLGSFDVLVIDYKRQELQVRLHGSQRHG